MKNCLYVIVFALLASCNSVKRSENKLYNGDYDEAIRLSLKKIKKSNNKKSTQQHIRILQDAFKKVVAEDLARVQLLKQENNPEDSREIFVSANEPKQLVEVPGANHVFSEEGEGLMIEAVISWLGEKLA